MFCQGDLFNHLIFWWPFIPRFHGYSPIKRRSNKAASQTGNKNIKAMCALGGREGEQHSVRRDGPCQETAGSQEPEHRDTSSVPASAGPWQPAECPAAPHSTPQHPTASCPALLQCADARDNATATVTSALLSPPLCR